MVECKNNFQEKEIEFNEKGKKIMEIQSKLIFIILSILTILQEN